MYSIPYTRIMPWKKTIFWFVNNSKYHHREMGLLSNIYMAAMHSTDFCMLVRHSFTVHFAALSNQLGGTFILSPLHQPYPPCGIDLGGFHLYLLVFPFVYQFYSIIEALVTQCGGLSMRCHRATVYRDIKTWRTSERTCRCRLDSSKVILSHSYYFFSCPGPF